MVSDASQRGVSIASKDTPNPVLLFGGRPLFRVGSVSERALFSFPWDSPAAVLRDMTHTQWAIWQSEHTMGYARAYPESGFAWWEPGTRSERILPWKVDRWVYDSSPDGEPVVDLTQPDDGYWKAFENTLQRCKEHDIVVIVQLYQACCFGVLSSDTTGREYSLMTGRDGLRTTFQYSPHVEPDCRSLL